MQNTMSITRALAELKLLNARITSAISSGIFVANKIGKNQNAVAVVQQNQKVSVEQAISTIQSSFDKVDSLIDRRQKIKSAIVLSNANTMVSVMNKEMTVAEAIELKSTVDFKKQLLHTMQHQNTSALNFANTSNLTLEGVIQQSLDKVYGSEKTKVDSSLLDAIAEPQRQQKEVSVINQNEINLRINDLKHEIETIESEIDFILSESNAKTLITV